MHVSCHPVASNAYARFHDNFRRLVGIMILLSWLTPTLAQTPFVDAVQVTAGRTHTCALTAGGGVKCWGDNWYGQLGDNSTTDRLTAVEVVALTSGVSAIAAGQNQTCALTTDGGVKCWGRVQLDDGTTTRALTPVGVSGLDSGVSAIAAGNHHTCALTTGGGVKCWGGNISGQLGDNSTTSRLTPVDVVGLTSGVSAIAAGGDHTCALTDVGRKCWGSNVYGQLGDGSTTDRPTPVDIVGLASGGSALAAGQYHTCALSDVGGVKCWGSNYWGQLGDNSITDRLTAVDVSGLTSGVSAIAAGIEFTCALNDIGGVKCWGENWAGQLGDYGTLQRLTAGDVSGLTSGVGAIAAGHFHACALTTGGGVKCWGYNSRGQLGDGSIGLMLSPVDSLEVRVPGAPTIGTATAADTSAIVAFTAPVDDGGIAISGYTATSSPGGLTSSSCTASPCTVSGLTNGTAYTFTVTATNDVGTGPASAESNSITPKDTQAALTASASPAAIAFGETSTLSTSGGSGTGAVSFAVTAGRSTCDVSGTTMTAIGVGSCTVTATRAGDANYLSATATAHVAVARASQTITFGSAPTLTIGATGAVSASGGASGNPVVFSSQTMAVCAVSGTNGETVTGISVGTCTIAANQAGSTNYLAADEAMQSFGIGISSAAIVVSSNTDLANAGDSVMFTATVSGQVPTGTVEFLADAVAITGCTARPLSGSPATATCMTDQLAAGELAITATYSGDASNAPASSAALTQTINARPSIDVSANASVLEDDSTVIVITVGDAETAADALQLTVTSSVPALISDSALAAGLGGSDALRTLAITPLADRHGSATLTLTVTDGAGASENRSVALAITAVNDPPRATYASNRSHAAGTAGAQAIAGFASNISPGQDESGQAVTFEAIVIDDPQGIISHLSVDPDGTLHYTLSGSNGIAGFEVTAVDDGGSANGGVDRGTAQRVRLVVGDGIDLVVTLARVAPAGAKLAQALAKGATMAAYRITVQNNGPLDAAAARLVLERHAGLLDVMWQCVAPAVCVPANGSGAIDTSFDLDVGRSLSVEFSGMVDTGRPFIELRAHATAAAGTGTLLDDDDYDVLIEPTGDGGVLKDGFER